MHGKTSVTQCCPRPAQAIPRSRRKKMKGPADKQLRNALQALRAGTRKRRRPQNNNQRVFDPAVRFQPYRPPIPPPLAPTPDFEYRPPWGW